MTLRFKLLLSVNLLLAAGMAVFLAADYRIELEDRLEDKRANLQDEARALSVAIAGFVRHGPQTIQTYLELVSSGMQPEGESTRAQHIVARIAGSVFHAGSARTDDAKRLLGEFRKASRTQRRIAAVNGKQMLVGVGEYQGISVYVGESLAEVRAAVQSRVLWRLRGLTLIALLGAAAVNLLLLRLVTRPLRRLVGTVRRIADGELGAHAEENFNTRELTYLAGEVNAMSDSLAEAEHLRQQRMDKARRIQGHLQPRPEAVEPLNVQYVHEPAEQVAGDYLDLIPTNDGFLLCMADVTGHGVPAAMGAAMLKTLFVAAQQETHQPDDLLRRVNAGFQPISLTEDFATVFMARLDRSRGTLRYASAGHDPAYLLPANGGCLDLASTGLLLGVDPEADWQSLEFPVQPGDRLVVVTDGLAETMSPAGQLLGRGTLRNIILDERDAPLDELCPNVLQRVARHRGPLAPSDDMTIIAIEV